MAIRHVWQQYNATSTVTGYTWSFPTSSTSYQTSVGSTTKYALFFDKDIITVKNGNAYVMDDDDDVYAITGAKATATTLTSSTNSAYRGKSDVIIALKSSSSWKTITLDDGKKYYDLSEAKYVIKMKMSSGGFDGVKLSSGKLTSNNETQYHLVATKNATTEYSIGSLIGNVNSYVSTTYPTNGVSGSYWYVYQGTESVNVAGVSGTVKEVQTIVCVGGAIKTKVFTYQGVNGVVKQG